ncbi:MAG TPA: AbrB/MazE/SpoVT family DNA-binding domain-containing protein [Firmicutes bacterium]|nr:AbrB/MazE/SpoVT family DNA-binding domain-containing protein [Bacillota bacterium]
MPEITDARPAQVEAQKPQAVVVDKRGRIAIPVKLRKRLQIEPGDTLFVVQKGDGLVVVNPRALFEELEKAAEEYLEKGGPVISLEDFCKEEGIDLASVRKQQAD